MAASSPLDEHASPVADHGTTSGKATASMIVGIIGLVMAILFWPLGIIISIVGLVLGMMAKGDIRRGATNGGAATAGIVCSSIGIVLSLLFLAVFGAIIAGGS